MKTLRVGDPGPNSSIAGDEVTPRPILEVEQLGVCFHQKDAKLAVLERVDFAIQPRQFVSVVGPSGAGKTTLLRCLCGLLAPSSGTVRLNGAPMSGPAPELAVVFQDYSRSLFPWMTVERNIRLALAESSMSRGQKDSAVRAVLNDVGLPDVSRKHPWQLSGGMQQRVAIARALIVKPAIMVMDEPFASVDAQTRFELEDLVRRLQRDHGQTVILVTHDIDEAVYVSDRVLVLGNRPSTVIADIEVDLPNPRSQLQTRAHSRFAQLRTQLLGLVIKSAKSHNRREGGDNP